MKYLIAMIAAISCLNLSAQRTNFSGAWKLNKEKSNFGGLSENSAATFIKINQQKDSIRVDRIFDKRDGGTFEMTDNLPMDGSTAVNFRQNVRIAISASLDSNGRVLKLFTTVSGTDDDYNSTQNWSLSPDGSILTIVKSDEGKNGSYTMNLIYGTQ